MRYALAVTLFLVCACREDHAGGTALRLTAISAGSGFSCALTSDSSAVCWGANQYFQLGSDSGTATCKLDPVATGKCSAKPVAVGGAHRFTAIDAGESHACALDAAGQAFCWGDNASGQLGNRDSSTKCGVEYYVQLGYTAKACSAAPRAVETTLRFTSLASGSGSTCGLTTDGGVSCWGSWTNRRFGDAGAPISVPGSVVRFEDAESFRQISADGNRVCALTTAGRLFCWGDGRETPAAVAPDTRFTSVSVGWRHACAITASGETSCWGENDSGQLGNGQSNPKFNSGDSTLHRVAGDVRFTSVHAGFLSTCGIATDTHLYCWGDGAVVGASAPDQCTHADARSSCALRPVRTELADVAGMTSGFTHRCAMRASGEGYCWGENTSHAVGATSSERVTRPELVRK
jgi:alpha-tubulin suppressor-like RCC1 family protein